MRQLSKKKCRVIAAKMFIRCPNYYFHPTFLNNNLIIMRRALNCRSGKEIQRNATVCLFFLLPFKNNNSSCNFFFYYFCFSLSLPRSKEREGICADSFTRDLTKKKQCTRIFISVCVISTVYHSFQNNIFLWGVCKIFIFSPMHSSALPGLFSLLYFPSRR